MKNYKEFEQSMKIRDLISDLVVEIDNIQDFNEKVKVLNYVRFLLHEISPLKHHPIDYVQWEKSENVEKNDYNPNTVFKPEFKSLQESILEDGYDQPIVTSPEDDIYRIVDGEHRRKSEQLNKKISESTFGYVPITLIRKDRRNLADRMTSTVRHNRARGAHKTNIMSDMVKDMLKLGLSDIDICKRLGMDAEEFLRMKQIMKVEDFFKNEEYGNAWIKYKE